MEMKIGNIRIKGSNRNIKIRYSANGEAYFLFQNNRYYLHDIMKCSMDLIKAGFDGIKYESAFSGVLVKLVDDENVKAYSYTSCG